MSLPNAATLKSLAEPLSQESLKKGVVDAVYSRGASEVLDLLPFGVAEGKTHGYNIKSKNPTGSASRDPRSRNRPSTGGQKRVRIDLDPKELSRDAETPYIDVNALSDTNNQRDINIYDEGAGLYEEFLTYFFHGGGGENALSGMDQHLDLLCGQYFGNTYSEGAKQVTGAKRQKVFATSTDAPDGVRSNLEVGMVDDALARIKGGRDNVRIVSDLDTWTDFKRSLNLLGGNTTSMLVDNVQRPAYDGCGWIVSDNAFSTKISYFGASIASASTTLGFGNTDGADGVDTWIGASDLDVGRSITVKGAGAGGSDLVTTVASVTSRTEVELQDAAGTTVNGAYAEMAKTHGFYVTKFDGMKGAAAYVPTGDATSIQKYNPDGGDYYGRLAGFDVMDLGISPLAGNIFVDRLIWEGNFCLHDPNACVRYSHYALANA